MKLNLIAAHDPKTGKPVSRLGKKKTLFLFEQPKYE